MLLGRTVFVYRSDSKFAAPVPGIVTGLCENSATLVDVEVFHPKSSMQAHTVAIERVAFCKDIEEVNAIFSKGGKYACSGYDPTDPKPFAPAEEVEAPKKAKGK